MKILLFTNKFTDSLITGYLNIFVAKAKKLKKSLFDNERYKCLLVFRLFFQISLSF